MSLTASETPRSGSRLQWLAYGSAAFVLLGIGLWAGMWLAKHRRPQPRDPAWEGRGQI